MDNEENKASLAIYDSSNHDRLTELLGLEPSLVLKKGEMQILGKPPRTIERRNEHDVWRVDSTDKIDQRLPFETHVKYIIEIMQSKAVEITEISKDCTVQLLLVGYSGNANLGIHMSAEDLIVLSALGVELDLDAYFIG